MGFSDPWDLQDPTGKPIENLYPHSQVWVSVGTDAGQPKNTCGSPVLITIMRLMRCNNGSECCFLFLFELLLFVSHEALLDSQIYIYIYAHMLPQCYHVTQGVVHS
jgi:hypothetical protein